MIALAEYGSGACGVQRIAGSVIASAPPYRVTYPRDGIGVMCGWLLTDDDLWAIDTWPPADQTDWSLARVALYSGIAQTEGAWSGGTLEACYAIEDGTYEPPSDAICQRAAWRSLYGDSGGAIDALAPWWDSINEVGEWIRTLSWGGSRRLVSSTPPDGLAAAVLSILSEAVPESERAAITPDLAPCDALVATVALDHYGDPDRRNHAITVIIGVHSLVQEGPA